MSDALPSLARVSDVIEHAFAKPRSRERGANEAVLRAMVEDWGRAKWPGARVCHELVIDRGSCRLDVAFVEPDRLNIVELKSGYDTMERVIHQCAMARAAGHEAWLVVDRSHSRDMRLLHFLLPTVGLIEVYQPAEYRASERAGAEMKVIAEAVPAQPYPEVMASLLWVAECLSALGYGPMSRPPTHASLVASLAKQPDLARLVCRELRRRNAQWRADPPMTHDDA